MLTRSLSSSCPGDVARCQFHGLEQARPPPPLMSPEERAVKDVRDAEMAAAFERYHHAAALEAVARSAAAARDEKALLLAVRKGTSQVFSVADYGAFEHNL